MRTGKGSVKFPKANRNQSMRIKNLGVLPISVAGRMQQEREHLDILFCLKEGTGSGEAPQT